MSGDDTETIQLEGGRFDGKRCEIKHQARFFQLAEELESAFFDPFAPDSPTEVSIPFQLHIYERTTRIITDAIVYEYRGAEQG